MLTSRARSARAFRQCTPALSRASSRMPSTSVIRRVRLLFGQRRRPIVVPRLKPRAMTGSPATTFAGAAFRLSSARHKTASCACMQTREFSGAGVPPPATVWTGSSRGQLR
eukprot:241753-Pleurochrysis_carterae.AAC.1